MKVVLWLYAGTAQTWFKVCWRQQESFPDFCSFEITVDASAGIMGATQPQKAKKPHQLKDEDHSSGQESNYAKIATTALRKRL